MLTATIIGHIGGNAEIKSANGKEFTTCRIANTDKWTDDAGQVHETTTWVDVIINGRPKVAEYLVKGQQVYVSGSVSLRVYSSAKDRCMKAGMTINARTIELLGGKADTIPGQLYRQDTGVLVQINKHFHAPDLVREETEPEYINLVSRNGAQYLVDRDGWVGQLPNQEQS